MRRNFQKKSIEKQKQSVPIAKRTKSQRLADITSRAIGSWSYILVQTVFVFVWISLNVFGFVRGWDPYPFIFLNLALSIVATYTAPIILMSQNREAERDRNRAINDLATDRRTERRIITLQKTVDRIERKINK